MGGQERPKEEMVLKDYVCCTNRAWVDRWSWGIGFLIYCKEELILYKSSKAMGCSALTIEAMALKDALLTVTGMNIPECIFLSDCMVLVNAVNSGSPPSHVYWKAFDVILQVWYLFRHNPSFVCYHIDRNQNELADHLAKKGRLQGWDCTSVTFPLFAT